LNKLEPTYLRYVYDGLHKGSLNAENASALPQGFIGLFESEFPSNISSVERISVLRRLTLWALFKGAVSTHLASEVLEEDEEDTKTLIDTYSKWFNSPEPGKYILYHDRLRSYFLQKLSSHEVQSLNEKLISYLEAALKDNREDEAQEYALAHLATHMAVESQLDNNYDRLHDFVNQEDLWKRQVRASKEYKWSQKAVQYGIKEGARRHNEMNTLTSTVNSAKLNQEEQNSAQQILDLLNEGDYQTALERALSFNGEKLMTIYLLMTHELTVGSCRGLSSKIEIINEIIENISLNEKIKGSYPYLAVYKYHVELLKLGIDDEIILDRLNFHEVALLNLLKYKNIDLDIHNELSNAQAGGHSLVNIYLMKSEILFEKNNYDEAKQILRNTKDIVIKLEKKDGHNPYNDGIETNLRSSMEVLVHKFKWLNYMFYIYIRYSCHNEAEDIIDNLNLYYEDLKDFIKKNIDVINASGNKEAYYQELVFLRRKYIESLIKVSSNENKFIYEALELINESSDKDLQPTFGSNYKELLLVDAMSKLFKIDITKKSKKRSFSLFNTHNKLDYQTEFSKLDSKYIQAQITLKNCEFLKNDKLDNEIKQAQYLVDEMEYGVNTFFLLEKLFQVLIEKSRINDAQLILSKLEKRTNNLKSKNTDFYYGRIRNIVRYYQKLNDLNGFTTYSRILIDTLISLDDNKSQINNALNGLLEEIRKEDQNFYKEFNILLEDSDISNVIVWDNSLLKHENFDLFKILKCFKDQGFGKYSFVLEGYPMFSSPSQMSDMEAFKRIIFDIDAVQIEKLLDEDMPNEIKDYLLDMLIEDDNYELFLQKILSSISTDLSRMKDVYNYTICTQLLSYKDLNRDLEIIDSFNFPEYPNPNYGYNPDNYPEHNFTVIYLMDYLAKNLKQKDIILSRANQIIDRLTSSDKNSIKNNKDNKLESYKFISEKLKELGFYNDALLAVEKWHIQTPKYIMNGVNKYREFSGFTIEIISRLNGLIKKDKLLQKIDKYIDEHDGYVTHLLSACDLLFEINELEKAIELAKRLHPMIDDDPFVEYSKPETVADLCIFLYKLGQFAIADNIYNSYEEHYHYPIFTPNGEKIKYLINSNNHSRAISFLKETEGSLDYDLLEIIYEDIKKLVQLEKESEAFNLFSQYKIYTENSSFYLRCFQLLGLVDDFYYWLENKLRSVFTRYIDSSNSKNNFEEFLKDNSVLRQLRQIFEKILYVETQHSEFIIKPFDRESLKRILTELINEYFEISSIEMVGDELDILFDRKFNPIKKDIYYFEDKFNNESDYSFVIKNANNIKKINSFLYHKSKMVCFFEKEVDEDKLNLLSQVIDVDEWKKISASI
jgi:hypothetical protein